MLEGEQASLGFCVFQFSTTKIQMIPLRSGDLPNLFNCVFIYLTFFLFERSTSHALRYLSVHVMPLYSFFALFISDGLGLCLLTSFMMISRGGLSATVIFFLSYCQLISIISLSRGLSIKQLKRRRG